MQGIKAHRKPRVADGFDKDGKFHIPIRDSTDKKRTKDIIDLDSQESISPFLGILCLNVDDRPIKKSKVASHPGSRSRHFPIQLETIESKPTPSAINREFASRGLSTLTTIKTREPFTETFPKDSDSILGEFKDSLRPKVPGQNSSTRRGLVQTIPGKSSFITKIEGFRLSWANLRGKSFKEEINVLVSDNIYFRRYGEILVGTVKVADVKEIKVSISLHDIRV